MQSYSRKAFTIIELVFVIVIVGVLIATALPRFTGISQDARISKLAAFVGTLNRSVGSMMWSNVQRDEPNQKGVLSTSTNYSTIIEGVQLNSIPEEFTGLGTPKTISLASCLPSATMVPPIGDPVGGLVAGKVAGTGPIGSTTYALGCIDGGISDSPRFYLYDEGALTIVY